MGDLSSIEAELARVQARESTVHAWVARHGDEAIRAAAEVAAANVPDGPLAGVTVGVKDIIDTVDLPTACGSVALAGRRPSVDAACVALARAAGAVVVGKTVTTEFAMLTPGPTTNPHRPTHTPGGSSSGSAAAVADGMVRVAFGTQTAGSVIRPASYCGVFALKPTHGLVPLAGVHAFSASLDTVGWYARTVADLAAMLHALTGASPQPPLGRAPRIGLYRSAVWDRIEASSRTAVDDAAERLRRAGATVVEVADAPELAPLGRAQTTIMLGEGARTMAGERAAFGDAISPALRGWLTDGDAVTAETLRAARGLVPAGRAALAGLLDGVDALLTPAAPGEAPEGLASTGDPICNRVWTLLGAPCVAVPSAVGPTGLPVGVQLVGSPWADGELLSVAGWAARALDVALAPLPAS